MAKRSLARRSWPLRLLTAVVVLSLATTGLSGHVSFGQGFPPAIDLEVLAEGEGVTIEGTTANGLAGYRTVGAGDVNGDGFGDLLVSAPQAGGSFVGEVYLVFGGASLPATLSVAGLDGTNGATFRGASVGESAGVAIAGAGDVDGDGLDDLLIAAPFASPGGRLNAGQAYLIYGRAAYAPVVSLDALDGAIGATLEGAEPFDQVGLAVGGGGDVNGDGRDDLLVSAHRSDAGGGPNAGAVYVVYGAEGIPATIDLGTLDGTNGVTVLGIDAEDEAGSALAHARDVNGDGFDDIVIGARRADPGGRAKAGEVYVVYGGDNLPATLPLASLDGENGFVVRGVDEDDEAGFAVAGIGDFNGDGFDDIAATAPVALPDFVLFGGETYVVYGGDRLPAVVELASLDGTNGTRFDGIDFGDTSGECVAGVGDVDQDGFADFVIGATLGDPGGVVDAGEAYVVLGAADYGASFDLEDLDGTNGSVLEGVAPNDATGGGCGGGVDLDGDGVEEVVVGAQGADPNGSASGRAYVVYGRAEVELIAAGVCPGDVTLRASGLTPGGLASVVAGSTRGETEIPAGECAGRAVDIADASLVAMLAADGAGELEIVRAVTESFCGGLLQWVDMESCRMSPVVALP